MTLRCRLERPLGREVGITLNFGPLPSINVSSSALFATAGVPTVLFGPGGAGAHGNIEWIDIDDVARCADVYLSVAEEFCR